MTTSTGRFLDAVSALLNICHFRSYEGEPAIRLEAIARDGEPLYFSLDNYIQNMNGRTILDTSKILLELVKLKEKGISTKNIASTAQYAIARGLSEIAIKTAKEKGIDVIGVSGGVAYNDFIVRTIKNSVIQDNLRFVQHKRIPPGDGGISIGQAIAGARKLQKDGHI
jgi:hydrogenase maturation protein HypF